MDDRQKNKQLRQAILKVIEQQLETKNPPETAQTLDRLTKEGLSRDRALQLIGYVVGYEVLDLFQKDRKYDEGEYIKRLHALPTLPWANDKDLPPA